MKRKLAGLNIAAMTLLLISVAGWAYPGVIYAPWTGVLLALVITFQNIRFRSRVKREGYEWKHFKVINHTYLSRLRRKPTGFVALGFNDGAPVRRYHFASSSEMRIPETESMLSIIRDYVPEFAKPKSYGDIYYYPIVLGYETSEY